MILKCPRCDKETESTGNLFRPFCSERCKLIDLGNWLTGAYHLPGMDAAENEKLASKPQKDEDKE